MQNSLWKLGALLGVIGVGFLVLLKAQNEMTEGQQSDESFSELAAIEELSDLDAGDPAGDGSHDALGFSAAPSKPMGIATSDAEESEPTPAIDPPAADADSAESDSVTVAQSDNPFGDLVAPSPPAGQTEPAVAGWEVATDADIATAADSLPPADETSAAPEEPTTTEEINPFGALVESFTSSSDEEPDAQHPADSADPSAPILPSLAGSQTSDVDSAPLPEETIEAAPIPTLMSDSPGDTGDPSGPAEEPTASLTAAADAFNPFGPAETAPKQPDDAVIEPQPEAVAQHVEAAPTPKPFEPTSLTALPPADGGPALMAPPAAPAETDLPSQVEPAALGTDLAETDTGTQIAQASAELPAGQREPNPFMVFPGTDETAETQTPQRQPAQPQSLDDQPAPEPMFPASDSPSSGRAWVGDTPRIEVPPQADPAPSGDLRRVPESDRLTASEHATAGDSVVLPDGTVEMTIMPRSGQAQPTQARQEEHADVNPFSGGPQFDEPPRQNAGGNSGHLEPPPGREASAAQPPFPDPGLSFSKGPIQPSAAEMPDSEPPESGNGLTSADFIGVGTISPDTPSTPQQAQLTIEKQAPADAALGQELIYNILVRNIGRAQAKNVVVEDLVPKGTELQGTDPQAHMTPDKKLVWKLGAMSPGSSRTIRIKVIPREAGQIGSVATVSFEAAVASRTVITAPQLRLALNGPQEVRVGEKAPYKFTLTNSGSADASNVFIRKIIPAGFEHPAAQQRNGVTDIEYEVGTLRKGESREVELTLLAVEEGDFQNHAILSADGNVNVEAHHAVKVVSSRLKIRREGPANRVVGSQARFTNTVTNESSRPLQGVTITETVPVGVKFVQASDGGYFNPQQRSVTWQINTLEPGGVRQLQTIVLAEQAGEVASTISAIDQQGDRADATSKLKVAGYSSLTVDVSNPARAIPVGEEVALRLKVRNGGTAAASGVETRVKLPPQLKFVSARGPVRYAQQGDWVAFEPIDRIDIQGEQTFDIVLAAAAESQDARVVVQLSSAELSTPLSEDESVVIYAE